MSYLMYNPFAPAQLNPCQGQTGVFSGKTEGEHWRTTSSLGPESNLNCPGTSYGTSTSSKERDVKPFPLTFNRNGPENSLITLDNSHSTFNIPLKEEFVHQPARLCPFFTMTQNETLSNLAPKVSTSSMFSAYYGQQSSSTSCSSFTWLPNQKTTTEVISISTSNVSACVTTGEGQRLSSEPSYFHSNPHSAGRILENYGLEKEDLNELLNYSEEETTAENLPYLLECIRTKKAKRAASAAQSKANSTFQPSLSTSGIDVGVGYGQSALLQDKISSSSLQPFKVDINEHTAPCSAGVDADVGRNMTSQSTLTLINHFQSECQSKDGPLASITQIKSGDLGSSHDQKSLLVVPPFETDQTIMLQTQPNQTSGITQPTGFGQTGMPKDKRPKIVIKPLKLFGSVDQNISDASLNPLRNTVASPSSNPAEKCETQLSQTSTSVPPLHLQHESEGGTCSGESKTQDQGSNIADPLKTQQFIQKTNIQTILQILQALQPVASPAAKPASLSSFVPVKPDVSDAISPSQVMSKNPVSCHSQSQPIVKTEKTTNVPSSKPQSPIKTESQKDMPSPAMMHDYAGFIPRTFSHTCCLCKKECAQLKDWVSHQASNLHNANCVRLRKQYPQWDGVVPPMQRDSLRSAMSLTPTSLHRRRKNCDSRSHSNSPSCPISRARRDKSSSRSRSRSYSPRCQRGSNDGRNRSSSSSHSRSHHQSSRVGKHKSSSSVRSSHRKQRSGNSSSSHSYSPSCHSSRDKKNYSSSSSHQHRLKSCSRSRSPSCSPCYDRSARSSYRPRSRSYEKLSSPKRINKKSNSPRRNHERQSSRGRSRERRLSPRSDRKQDSNRCLKQQASPRKTDKRLSPVRRHVSQSPTRKIEDRRWSPTHGWINRVSQRKPEDKRLSPVRRHFSQSPPRKIEDRRWSPTHCWTSRMSARKTEDKRLSPVRRHVSQSPPRKIEDRRWSPTHGWIRWSPRKTDKQFSPRRSCKSPTRNDNRGQSPEMSYDQQSSPVRTDYKRRSKTGNLERQSSTKGMNNTRCSPIRNRVCQSSPRNKDDRRWSPKRSPEQPSSPRRNCDRRRSPLRTDDKHWSPTRFHEGQSSPERNGDKQRSPKRSSEHQRRANDNIRPLINCKIWWSPTRNDDEQWLPKVSQRQQSFPDEEEFSAEQSDEESSSARRSRKRHASLEEEPSSKKKKSSSIQILTKQLLETSDVKSVSKQSNIKDVVNLVVPVLLAKLAEDQDSSSPLALPLQDKKRVALTSLTGSKTSSSSAKIQSKLKCNQATSSKKHKFLDNEVNVGVSSPVKEDSGHLSVFSDLKDRAFRRALSITTKCRSEHRKLKAKVTNDKGLCENLDLLPIKTLLSLHQKLVCKAKRLSSQGKHTSKSKAHLLKMQTLKSVVLVKDPLMYRSLTTRPNFYRSSQRGGRIISRKDEKFEVKEKDRIKGVRRIILPESKMAKKTITKVKADASKASENKPLDKTAKCSGVAKIIKVEDSQGDKLATLNASPPKVKETKWLVGKVVTTSDPFHPQQTIVKIEENPLKTLPKVRPKEVPESKKTKSLKNNPYSGDTREKPAKAFKKDKDSETAVKDTTKVGETLKTAVPATDKSKKMVTKVKGSASKRCTNKKQDGKVSEALMINLGKSINDQPNCKGTETTPSMAVITNTLPMTENSPEDSQASKPEICETNVLRSDSNESQLLSSKGKEETSSDAANMSFKLNSSENLPEIGQGLKTETSEIKVTPLLEDTAEIVKTKVSTETSTHTELTQDGDWMKTVKSIETLKPGNTASIVSAKADAPGAEGDAATPTLEPVRPVSVCTTRDKPTNPTWTQQSTIKAPETSVEAVGQAQPKMLPNPDLAAPNQMTDGKHLVVRPLSTERSAAAPFGALQKTGGEEKNNQNDAETQKNPLQNPVSNISVLMNRGMDPAKTTSNLKTIVNPNRTEALLTVGERMAQYLNLSYFYCVPAECILSSKPFAVDSTLLLITNLPVQKSCSYTEEEVVHLLCKFGFQYAPDNIYVIPQTGMAFVLMPNERSVIDLVLASVHGQLSFKWHKLFLHIVKKDMSMIPMGFYRSLIELTPLDMKDDGTSIIYIQNISPSDTTDLRKALRRIGHVRNFLPLLNKVFVEFESVYDADRLGVWYSLMRMGFHHTVNRLNVPRSIKKSLPPKLPLKALPDIFPEAGIPNVKYGIPQGSTAPCWVTMMTPPYVFPTVCPWFNIPNFLTVQGEDDILTAPRSGSEFFTIMLTGLPEGKYKHEDVAKLVWRYFAKQNLQSLYRNVLVLPLQRRAFVFFCDWEACRSFVADCVKKPLSVRNCALSVHFILEDMQPGCSEETMYRSLFKWSSGYVPELFSLEKRLLCVETYETNVNLIKSVMKEVAAIASFVSFVPLANRICIEMVSPSCAVKVLEELPLRKILSPYVWNKVGDIECVEDINQRLKETSEINIKLEAETLRVIVELPALKTEAPSTLPEPCNNVAAADPAVPATFCEPAISESESKPEEKADECPDVVLDSESKTTPTVQECHPCEKISTVADPDKKIQTDPLSGAVRSVSDESTEAPSSVQTKLTPKEVVKEQPGGLDTCLTPGEKIGSLLQAHYIPCLCHDIIISPKAFSLQSRILLLTNLPQYWNGRFTESDISNLLHEFGFQYEDKNLFVIPQACMAFVLMPNYQKAREVFLAANQGFTLCGSKLGVEIVSWGIFMIPFGFYKSVMKMINFPVTDDGTSTIYIQNISPKEAQDLRESLKKIGSVKNFLPLLNKVFIEFESAADADRLGVWYSLLKRPPTHNIYRIKSPQSKTTSSPPKLAAMALPEGIDMVIGPVVPVTNGAIPEGSQAPFLITMPTAPFIFPTVSPWFTIPKFKTVCKEEDLFASISVASKFSTIMLTGLPEGNYKHKDVAKLVWKYFTEQNLLTLVYNIVVLPLQRRAFVYFKDWQICQHFVKDFLKTGVSFKGHNLHTHLVLEDMHPGSSEETMYQSLMKWSNAHVPELESLQERLVCVVLSETCLNFKTIVEFLTSISPIVSFLPLANRLCIEMAESRGVDQVVANFAERPANWNKVRSVESVKSLTQRLKDFKAKICHELSITYIFDETPVTKSEPQTPISDVKTKPPVQKVTNPPNSVLVTKNLAADGSGTQEKMEIGASETKNVQSKVHESSSTCGKDQLSALVPRNKTDTGNKAAPEKNQQAQAFEDKKVKGGKAVDETPLPDTPTTAVGNQTSKPSTHPLQSPQTNLKPQGTSVKATPQVQKCINPNSKSVAEENWGKIENGSSETKNVQLIIEKATSDKRPEREIRGSDTQNGEKAADDYHSPVTPTTAVETEPSKPSTNPHQSPQTNVKPQGTSVKSAQHVQKCVNSKASAEENQAKMEIGTSETKNVQSNIQMPSSEKQLTACEKAQHSALAPRNMTETGNKAAPESKQQAETVGVKEVKGGKIAGEKPSPAISTSAAKTHPYKPTNSCQSPQTNVKPQGTSVMAPQQVQKCMNTNSSAKENKSKMETGSSDTKNGQVKVQEPTAKKQPDACLKAGNKAAPEKKQQAEAVEDKEVKGGKAVDENPLPATQTTTVKTEPSKPSTNPHQSPETNVKPQGTSVNAPQQIKKCMNPNSSAECSKTKRGISENSDVVKTPASAVSAGNGPDTKSSATGTSSQPAAAAPSPEAYFLTPGEKLQHFLQPFKLCHLGINTILSPIMFSYNITLIITNLPRFFDGSYTEAELINLLHKLGFQCDNNAFFVVPQSRMAFLIRPKVREVQHFFGGSLWRNILFKGRKLEFLVLRSGSPMTLVGFYKFLMSFTGFRAAWTNNDPQTLLYFHNISANEARDLREALRNVCNVLNYLPLLNKAFVHCKTPTDAIRLEVWYSRWKWSRSHNVQQGAPAMASQDLQLWENTAVESNVPMTTGPIPDGTSAPFWVTRTTSPYVVYTATPFFIIPAFQTINRTTYVKEDVYFATIMLTGLPNRTYTHEDVAMLVWKYLPEKNLHTLYNNVVVLPLQRRAFVFFSSSEACFRFLQDQNENPVYLKGFIPNIHSVLEYIHLGSSEESMFRTLMQLSNINVPELKSLEERLLVVEVSGTNEHIVMMLMKEVASIATFASFLPLANRIYIEMAESSGAKKVLENLSVCKLSEQCEAWKQVGRVESLLSRKERLKDCRKIAVNLERGTMSVYTEAKPLKRREDESATCSSLSDNLIVPHKDTEHAQVDLGILNELKAVILQHKIERNSTLSKELSTESGSSSSSKQTTKKMNISHSSSATKDVSVSIKVGKSSASLSESTKISLSSSSTPLSIQPSKNAPESTKSPTNPSSSSSDGCKSFSFISSSKSVKSSASFGQKEKLTKGEISQASHTPSTYMGQSTSLTAKTHQSDRRGPKPVGAAVAKADHSVSTESCTVKSQSGSNLETSSEVSLPVQNQKIEFTNQTKNRGCFKNETLKETTEGKENDRKKGNNAKSPVKESYQTSYSVAGQKDEQNCCTEAPLPDKGRILCCEDKKATFNKMEKDALSYLQDDGTEQQVVAIKCEGSAVKPHQRMKASSGEEEETLSNQQSSDKHLETHKTVSSEEMKTGESTEEMLCKDSVPDESAIQSSVRKTNGEAKQDEENQVKLATDEQTISQSGKEAAVKERKIITNGHAAVQGREQIVKNEDVAVKPIQKTKDGKNNAKDSDIAPETQSKDTSTETRDRTNELVCDNPPALNFGSVKGHLVSFGVYSKVQMCHRSEKACAVEEKEITTDGQEREYPFKNESEDGENSSKQEESSDELFKTQSKDSSAVIETIVTDVMVCKDSFQNNPATKRSFRQITRSTKPDKTNENKEATTEPMMTQSGKDASVEQKEISMDDHASSVKEENHLVNAEGLAVERGKITRLPESEDRDNSSKKQSLGQHLKMHTKGSSAERVKEVVCKTSVQDKSGTKRSFRETTRLANQDKTIEEKLATNEPKITTRSTSRKREMTEKDSLDGKKEKTSRRETPSRQQNKEKTQRGKETSVKAVTPTTCKQELLKISDDVDLRNTIEEEKETTTPRTVGRPKKKARPTPGRRTRSSSAAVKVSVEFNQSKEKEVTPTERAGVHFKGKVSAETAKSKTEAVLDSPAQGQKTQDSRGLKVSYGVGDEDLMYSQSGKVPADKDDEHLVKDGLSVKPSRRSGVSKSEHGKNSSRKQESSDSRSETQLKESSAEMDTEKKVCENSGQDKSGAKRSFRLSTRSANKDKTNEDKAATKEPTVATRSAIRKMEMTEKDVSVERKDETPKMRRKTPAGSPPQSDEKTQETEEETAQGMSNDVDLGETEEEKKEAPRTRKGLKKTARPPLVRNKRKMEFPGPEPKRTRLHFARVAAVVKTSSS